MSRSLATTSWCTKVVLSGLLAGGSLTLLAGTAQAGAPDPLAPVTFTDSTQPAGYTVAAGVCAITVDAVGAQGGNGDNGGTGGRGGHVVSTLAVVPTEEAEIFVGGQGSLGEEPSVVRGNALRGRTNDLQRWLDRNRTVHPDEPPPASGGLSGGEPTGGPAGLGNIRSGGGGGASYIFLNTVRNYPVIVAAGGGGAAGTDPGRVAGGAGGAGGVVGVAGRDGTGSVDSGGIVRSPAEPAWDGKGGRGATGAQAGAGGAAGTSSEPGLTGTQPYGGSGGGTFYNGEQTIFASGTGGGGGAGIWGGGGGGAAQSDYPAEAAGGGGGGGSNLAPAGSAVNGVADEGGNGFVTVTPHATCPPSAVQHISAKAGNATARVTWTAPADAGGAPITGYRITAYINGVVKKTVTTTGTGLTALVAGLINGTHYTFTVAAINSAGTGADSVHSNVVQPLAPPVPPFVLQSQTLWGHVEIAAHNTRFAFEVTFNQTRPSLRVTLTAVATGKTLAATTIHPATANRRFTGVLAFPTSAIQTWGAYTYTLTTGAPTSTFVFRSDVRKHSTLALGATRAHGVVMVTGSAKVLNTTSNSYVGWANRTVEIQRETTSGWVTVATTVTNARGHVAKALHLPAGTTLRLVDADTATQFGRASNTKKV